jgi:hypothetical protein
MHQFATEERPIGDLFADLTADLRVLVRQEVALARAEIGDKMSHLGPIAIGGVLAFVGLQAFAATAILALSLVLPTWLSALIVGAVLALVGGLLAWSGYRGIKARGVMPQETVESLKEDAQWAKEQLK